MNFDFDMYSFICGSGITLLILLPQACLSHAPCSPPPLRPRTAIRCAEADETGAAATLPFANGFESEARDGAGEGRLEARDTTMLLLRDDDDGVDSALLHVCSIKTDQGFVSEANGKVADETRNAAASVAASDDNMSGAAPGDMRRCELSPASAELGVNADDLLAAAAQMHAQGAAGGENSRTASASRNLLVVDDSDSLQPGDEQQQQQQQQQHQQQQQQQQQQLLQSSTAFDNFQMPAREYLQRKVCNDDIIPRYLPVFMDRKSREVGHVCADFSRVTCAAADPSPQLCAQRALFTSHQVTSAAFNNSQPQHALTSAGIGRKMYLLTPPPFPNPVEVRYQRL
jgi:hypothetical protein